MLLDLSVVEKPAGFPDHPHRGFETVSYVLSGALSHEDFRGHKGIIRKGDLQWMTAGKGILHSEMPYGKEPTEAIQLWVNLPAAKKMIDPNYQELKHEEIPTKSENGTLVKIIAGESMGIKSPVYTNTPTLFLDFKLENGSKFTQAVPENWNAFVLVLRGTGLFGNNDHETRVTFDHTVILTEGNSISFRNDSKEQLHFLLIAGEPINEPVARHGPFVMNTYEEIEEAISDYRNQENGFEKASSWVSDQKRNNRK